MIVKASPLNGRTHKTNQGLLIRELPDFYFSDLRVNPNSPGFDVVSTVIGIPLPGKTGLVTASTDHTNHVLCLAPDWWLMAGTGNHESYLKTFQNPEHHISLVDVSGQRTTIEVSGQQVKTLLAHLWEQDLRDASFPPAQVRQGLMAKAQVILWRSDDNTYRVLVRSSFALHVWAALIDAATEY